MKKTLSLGTILFDGRQRPVKVEIELSENNNLSICGDIYTRKGSNNVICSGQILKELQTNIDKFAVEKQPQIKKILGWWEKYHLNDINAGCKAQEKCLQENKDKLTPYDYLKACEILKENNLYKVPLSMFERGETTKSGITQNENGDLFYTYGCGWVRFEIPQEDLNEIKELLK